MSTEYKKEPQVNPKWLKPSMTVRQAANQAKLRDCTLKASWDRVMGVRIVAVPIDRG